MCNHEIVIVEYWTTRLKIQTKHLDSFGVCAAPYINIPFFPQYISILLGLTMIVIGYTCDFNMACQKT